MVTEPNSFGNKDLIKSINNASPATDLGQHQTESQSQSDVTDLAAPLAAHGAGATSADLALDLSLEFRLNQVLEQARVVTGATGAVIALVRGEEMVCRAGIGSGTPGIGVCLDLRNGLSGSCIQTRQLQQCTDTETDPRVDPAACRHFGAGSIVALPLMDGDKLFGVFEVFSSRPNAFSQRDLDSLRALTDRILESTRQDGKAAATVRPEGSGSFLHKLEEVVPQDKSLSSESDSRLPRRERTSRRDDMWILILGVLVIGTAILWGTLVGWRLGWQKAVRASSPPHRANAPSQTGRPDHTVSAAAELQPEECGQAAAAGIPARPPSGELTICQGSRLIFPLPPSAPSPIRDLQTPQGSPGLEADPTRR